MREEEKYIKSYDGELIYAKEYSLDNPKATIILTSDIKEHSLLYENFAKNLLQLGYNVFTYDLRAHKNTAKEIFGTYSNNFFNDCVRDLLYLNKYLSKKYNVKVVNIGVGIGSVIITRMLQFNNENCLNVLIGSPFNKTNFGNIIIRGVTRFKMVFFNKNSEAKLVNKYLNYCNEHKFQNGSFQSTNVEYINRIKNDKFCNFNLSANIINSIYKGISETFSAKNLLKINKQQRILLCSGEYDVITKFSKRTNSLSHKLNKVGLKHHKIVFKNLRHNLINESSNVFEEYLIKFIEENIKND